MTNEELYYASNEDQLEWLRYTQGLPTQSGFSGNGRDKFGEEIPFSSGPHSLRCFREALEIVKPDKIFEIGFNLGYSAAVFLNLSNAIVFSTDISYREETIAAAKILRDRFGAERFQYENRYSFDFINFATISAEHDSFRPDIAFIDGVHYKEPVVDDIVFCLELRIPYLLFDDILPQFGNVQEAINEYPQLQLVKEMGNIALYKNKNV